MASNPTDGPAGRDRPTPRRRPRTMLTAPVAVRLRGAVSAGAAALTVLGLAAGPLATGPASAAAATTGQARPAAVPKGLEDQFLAVSCPVRQACVAVGTTLRGKGTAPQTLLAERWNGRTWSVTYPALPAGANGGELTGVSCTSASACTAVGAFFTSTGPGNPLAERWNGHRWAIQHTPSSGRGAIPFAGVSCVSATSCTAVGFYDFGATGTEQVTLVEHWDGRVWAEQPTPPIGNPGSALEGVSCPTAGTCTAAGSYLGQSDEGPGSAPLAMRGHSGIWAIQPTPINSATGNVTAGLTGVSCPTLKVCTAVGVNVHGGPLVLRWEGGKWQRQQVTGAASVPELAGVSCPSSTACMAVAVPTGVHAPGRGERWNGRSWLSSTVPVPRGGRGVELAGVSCSSPVHCTAVGSYGTSRAGLTLAERWNGHSWTPQPTPNPVPAS